MVENFYNVFTKIQSMESNREYNRLLGIYIIYEANVGVGQNELYPGGAKRHMS